MIRVTTIYHEARTKLKLSIKEYVLADLIQALSTHPDTKWCFKTRDEMGELIGVPERTIAEILASLEKKEIVEINAESACVRTTPLWYETVENYRLGIDMLILTPPKVKLAKEIKPEYAALANELKDLIIKNNLNARISLQQVETWAEDARKMVEIDKGDRTLANISEMIKFSQQHHFWHKNIHSMGTLREKWDRLILEKKTAKPLSLPERERNLGGFNVTKKPI